MSPADPPHDHPDHEWMGRALALARRGLGRTWPNPAVGCVLVSAGGEVVGEGFHARAGGPHAEAAALAEAGDRARGARAFVTLEPCAHHGRTPPCADALIAAGVADVRYAVYDPDPRVDGRGAATLEAAGIPVRGGLLEAEAREVLGGFLTRVREGRPEFLLKAALTLDGQMAPASGVSRWITGPEARAEVHRMRDQADAILVGSGTALADDPSLTVRDPEPGDGRQPLRLVLDRRGRLPVRARVLGEGTWILTAPGSPDPWREALAEAGAEVLEVGEGEGPWLGRAAALLGARGLTRVLVEGGPGIHGALLEARLADRAALFYAPRLVGAGGFPLAGAFRAETLEAGIRLEEVTRTDLGPDWLIQGRVSYPPPGEAPGDETTGG